MNVTGRHAFKARLKSDCSNTLKSMRKHRAHYLFMLPYLIIFTLFTIYLLSLRFG